MNEYYTLEIGYNGVDITDIASFPSPKEAVND